MRVVDLGIQVEREIDIMTRGQIIVLKISLGVMGGMKNK